MKLIRIHKKDSAEIFKATLINEQGKQETFIRKSATKDYKSFWFVVGHIWGKNIYKGKEEPDDDIWREYGFSTSPNAKPSLGTAHTLANYDKTKNKLGVPGEYHQRIIMNKVVPVEVVEE